MAHTDRDWNRWFWSNHHTYECPNSYRYALREYGSNWHDYAFMSQTCDVCPHEPHRRYWVSLEAKSDWNKSTRRKERTTYRQTMQQLRSGHVDTDEVVFNYRRPYYN